jgi:8-oxo-dGTP pyrophosphatase MutT (NUDIX family)
MPYEPAHIHVQSAVIPWRTKDRARQVLLITSRSGKRWVVPKGIVEPDLTPADSAVKEAYEEAGIQGRVSKKSVGSYTYEKWGGICDVEVFVLKVNKELQDWPEADVRERCWFTPKEAAALVAEEKLAAMIRQVAKKKG